MSEKPQLTIYYRAASTQENIPGLLVGRRLCNTEPCGLVPGSEWGWVRTHFLIPSGVVLAMLG